MEHEDVENNDRKTNQILPITGQSLVAVWQRGMVPQHTGYRKPLTRKEIGQLKQLAQRLGTRTTAVIDYALRHWLKFAARAGGGAGGSFPTDPQIGFLLVHQAVAMDMLQSNAPPRPRQPMPPRTPLPVTPPETPYQLTQEELQEMLDGLTH